MSLTLLTYYTVTDRDDYQRLADLVIPNRDSYCARHGYRHLVKKGPYKDPSLYYAIQRLWFLLDDMEKDPSATSFYWTLNLQSVITNHAKAAEEIVAADQDKHFWITHDVHGLNAGSFLVRNTPEGRAWIRFVAESAPHVGHCWHEQRVMQLHEGDPEWAPHIRILPQSAINSYLYAELYRPWTADTPGDWRKGDLCLGLPGTDLNQRLGLVTRFLSDGSIVR